MAKYVPQKNAFDLAMDINKGYTILLYISFVLSILPVLRDFWGSYKTITTAIIFINVIIISFMFIMQIYREIKLNDAENIRRSTLLDDAFGSKIAEETAIEYYDNHDMEFGYRRLLANICENSLFSEKIASKMFWRSIPPIVILVIVIIYCSVIGFSNISFAIPCLQILLSGVFIIRTIDICLYKFNVKSSYDKAISLLEYSKEENEVKISSVLQLVIRYESNISRFQVILNEKLYNQLNPELTKKWNELKKRYVIH